MQNVRRLFDPGPVQSPSGFSSRDLVRLLRKHRAIIIVCCLVSAACAIAILCWLPPVYISHAKILVRIEEEGSPSFFSGIASYREPNAPEPAARMMENEMELIETWPIAAEVVTRLNLTYDQVYHPPYAHFLRPLADSYDHIVDRTLGWPVDPEKYGFADTVAAFQKSVETKTIESKTADTNSNILEISLRGVNADTTQKALQTLVDYYIGYENLKLNREGALKAEAVIEQNLNIAEHEVADAQQKMQDLLAKSGLTSADKYAAQSGDSDSIHSTPGEGGFIGLMKSHLLDLQMKLVLLQSSVTAHTPEMLSLEKQIDVLGERLTREQRRHAEDDRSLLDIKRQVQFKEATLLELQKRLSQVRLFLAIGASQISNRVVVEQPLRPRSGQTLQRILIAVASSFGGLFLGIALAGLREYTDHRLQSEADIQQYLGVSVVANLPFAKPAALFEALDALTVRRKLSGSRIEELDVQTARPKLSGPRNA
jgi:uncharacterized protein involved in exopolysaccharide biosynthesis